jgi:outer membrane lipoprotein-sorting protein
MLCTISPRFRFAISQLAAILAFSAFPALAQNNPNQIAILKWYTANKSASFAAQTAPWGMAFDGANMWVANAQSNSVSKFRVSDGANLGNFALGHPAQLLAFDGASIWASDGTTFKITKIRPSDGAILWDHTVPSTGGLIGMAFDGTSMWIGSSGGIIEQLRISDGAALSAWYIYCQPEGTLAFDGTNVWAACPQTNQVAKQPVAGGNFSLQTVGNWPLYLAFDGSSMWVANNSGASTVQKLNVSTMAIVATANIGSTPTGIAFDGANMWAATAGSTLVKFRTSDGGVLATTPSDGSFPLGIAFDGANIWSSNYQSATVSKY